jgi:PIN domain nuclease of toxin-antitoxin system
MLLLDTHVLLWIAEGLPQLSLSSRELIDNAAAEEGLAVSAISFWEVAMLEMRQRISLSLPVPAWREVILDKSGATEIPVTGDVAIESVFLPGGLQEDPADRLLVATARLQGCRLATRDEGILQYGAAGHVNCAKV